MHTNARNACLKHDAPKKERHTKCKEFVTKTARCKEQMHTNARNAFLKRIAQIARAARSPITTGRRRLTGSPKLQIIFHKKATKYRSLWREMTFELNAQIARAARSPMTTEWRRLVGSLILIGDFTQK